MTTKAATKVIVALSGGVDSAVAAALLQRQGYQVEAIFMKNWSPTTRQSLTDCPWQQDQEDAAAVAQKLGIPFRSVNFEREYRERVVNYFLREYAAGRTPNPDIICNKEIKFKRFWEVASAAGAEYIATGHYARVQNGVLYRGRDSRKDQSYFLYALTREQLERSIFPLGDLLKSEVRQLAAEFGLPNARKKDSQGICFIGQLDLKRFLGAELEESLGEVYLLPESSEPFLRRKARAVRVGGPARSAFYTIGERAGELVDHRQYLKATGKNDLPPLYVLYKDKDIYLTKRHDDPDLYSTNFILKPEFATIPIPEELSCQVRYQQRERLLVQRITPRADGGWQVRLQEPAWALAAGQAAVFYQKQSTKWPSDDQEWVAGGGTVERVWPLSQEEDAD